MMCHRCASSVSADCSVPHQSKDREKMESITHEGPIGQESHTEASPADHKQASLPGAGKPGSVIKGTCDFK